MRFMHLAVRLRRLGFDGQPSLLRTRARRLGLPAEGAKQRRLDQEDDGWAVDALGAPHVGERTEKALISSFVDRIAQLTPQLVTFNGASFDLPVLRYRAMVHGIAAPGLSSRPYFKVKQTQCGRADYRRF
jgi:Predicted 3'-5' exonuclease related to the exonuclease domain of PolB